MGGNGLDRGRIRVYPYLLSGKSTKIRYYTKSPFSKKNIKSCGRKSVPKTSGKDPWQSPHGIIEDQGEDHGISPGRQEKLRPRRRKSTGPVDRKPYKINMQKKKTPPPTKSLRLAFSVCNFSASAADAAN